MALLTSTCLGAIISVEVSNISQAKGKLWIALYRPDEQFMKSKPAKYIVAEVNSLTNQTFRFEVESGKYAMTIYHDLNGNDQLDKNLFGIPKEPYGLSNNFRPRLAPPKFSDCVFQVSTAGTSIKIKMIN